MKRITAGCSVCLLLSFLIACGDVEDPAFPFSADNADGTANEVWRGGELRVPLLGIDQAAIDELQRMTGSCAVEADFFSGLFEAHRWDIRGGPGDIIRMEIDTFGTFVPVVRFSYNPVIYESGSRESVWLDAAHGLTQVAPGRYELTVVTGNVPVSAHLVEMYLTSAAALASDGKVDPAARYSLRMLPVQGSVVQGNLQPSADGSNVAGPSLDELSGWEISYSEELTVDLALTHSMYLVQAESIWAVPYPAL